MKDVDLLIPTLRRPEPLARALRSAFAQDGAAALLASIVVVDNSPEGCSRSVVEALRPASPAPLVYVHAPRPGVATARNAGLAASDAPLVAFLDDDEVAPPGWLSALRTTHLDLDAAVTFGPVRGVAEGAHRLARPYLDHFFSRIGPDRSGPAPDTYGCGNSMMTRALALTGAEPFDVRSDLTGGEDDRLFDRLKTQGRRFGWAAPAFVYEHAPVHRSNLRYALKRAFVHGQSPSQSAWRARRGGTLLGWMAVGAGQAITYAAAALALASVGRLSSAPFWLDRAVRGLGKLFWPVTLRLYGLAAAPAPTPPPAPGEQALAAG